MNYKELLINRVLKHENTAFVDLNNLEYYLWYSCTKQSYIQRTNKYDNTILDSSKCNIFIALLLLSIYKLDSIFIYEGIQDEIDNKISQYGEGMLLKNIMCIHMNLSKEKSLFYVYFERLRNSLAHGTFNFYNGKFYHMGQWQAKVESKINFLLQSNKSVFEIINIIDKIYNINNINYNSFLLECIKGYFEIDEYETNSGKRFYSKKYKKYIIIDSYFTFKPGNHIGQIRDLLNKYPCTDETTIIITENKGNFNDKSLISENGLCRVVFASEMIDYFNIKQIKIIK